MMSLDAETDSKLNIIIIINLSRKTIYLFIYLSISREQQSELRQLFPIHSQIPGFPLTHVVLGRPKDRF